MRHPVGIKGVVPDTPSQPFSDDPFTRHPIDDEAASGVRAAPFCPGSRAPPGAGASVLLALRRDHWFVRLAAKRRCLRPAPANLHTAQTRAGSGASAGWGCWGHRAGGAGGTTRLLARGDLARGPRSVAGRDRIPRVAGTGVPILGGTTSSFGRGRRGRPRAARGGALTSAGHHRRPAAALRPPARRGVHLAQRRRPGVRVLGRTHPGRRRPCGRRRGVDHEPTEAEPVLPLHRRT